MFDAKIDKKEACIASCLYNINWLIIKKKFVSGNVFVFQINYVKEVEALSSEGELNRNVQN